MTSLIAAAAFFVLLHLLVSGTRLRDALTGRIGEGPYMGLFSLASLGGLAWLIFAYGAARGATAPLWPTPGWARWAQLALTFAAFLLIVPGLATANPTSVRQEGRVSQPGLVRGMLRITRHPFLWGVAIWAGGHLLVNGDTAALVLFGSLLVLAVSGTFSIDAKRRRKLGPAWEAFAAQTSNAPFAAILAGRQSLKLGEIGWRIPVAIVLWGALLMLHPYAFGVSPLPA